jgi:Tol biopolymer transport system component
LDQHALRKVNGTEDARGPFFSPDGNWVAFSTEGGLQKVRLPEGGNPVPICQVKSAAFDGTWLENGYMVFSTDRGLFQVPESGGEPEQLTTLNMDDGETGHHFPHALSDDSILFTLVSDSGRHAAVFSFDDETWKILVRNASDARFDPAGYLVFARNGEILAATYDPVENPLEVGDPVPIIKDVHTTPGHGGAVVTHFATSNNGMLAFAPPGPARENDTLVWVYPDDTEEGREEEIVSDSGQWMHQRISPTGDRILFNKLIDDGKLDLYIHDIKRNQTQQLTFNGSSYDAEWDPEPDADRIVFMSLDAVGRGMYLVDADFGELTPKRIADGKPGSRPHLSNWTDNGDTVVYFDRWAGGIWLVDPKPGSEPRELPLGNSNERWARVSPDGKLIAYVGDENQRREVYVQQYPTPGRRVRVSVNGGGEPLWSPDSRTLFFRQNDSVFESAITLTPNLTAEIPPRRLFSGVYDQAGAGHQHYDIDPHYVTDPDRKRFLMIKHGKNEHRPSRVHVIRSRFAPRP